MVQSGQSIEKQVVFGSNKAGERVGWVAVSEIDRTMEDETTPVAVHIVTATVGPEGAWLGQSTYENRDGSKSEPFDAQSGFLAVSAISTVLASKEGSFKGDESNLRYLRPSVSSCGPKTLGLLSQGDCLGMYGEKDTSKQWAQGKDAILGLLRERLQDKGFGDRYSQLYYWLNMNVGQTTGMPYHNFDGVHPDDLLLPDKSMKTKTLEQLRLAYDIESLFSQALANDHLMQRRLTVFSDVPAGRVTEVFTENRRSAHELEIKIRDKAAQLAVGRLVWSDVGTTRSWPYMNAGESNEAKAFGMELSGLKDRNIEPASGELDREINELTVRQKKAQFGAMRFLKLSDIEKHIRKT